MPGVRYCADCLEWVTGKHDCPMRCRGCHKKLEIELAEDERFCPDCSELLQTFAPKKA